MKNLSVRVIIGLIIALQIVTILPINQASAGHTKYFTIADSSTSANSAKYITLGDYRNYIDDINWPQRNGQGNCDNKFYETLPWVPFFGWQSGNNITSDGNNCGNLCGTEQCDAYYDAGWCNNDSWSGNSCDGAWLSPTAFNWGIDGANINLPGTSYTGTNNVNSSLICDGKTPCSSKLDSCKLFNGGAAPLIWATDTQDNNDYSDRLAIANGYSGYSTSNIGLYSHGISIFRNNFEIKDQQTLDLIRNTEDNRFIFQANADDWFRAYINGIWIYDQNDSAGGSTFYDLPDAVKSSLRVGQNNISFEVIDKAVWSASPLAPQRGVGLCYALTLEDKTNTYVPPALNCSKDKSSVNINEDVTFTATNGTPPYTWTVADPGATPVTSGNNNETFKVSYSSYIPQTKNITLTDSATPKNTKTCTVDVTSSSSGGGVRRLGPWDSVVGQPPIL